MYNFQVQASNAIPNKYTSDSIRSQKTVEKYIKNNSDNDKNEDQEVKDGLKSLGYPQLRYYV